MSKTASKLVIGGLLIALTTGYMAYLGASTSWQYYLTVDECLASLDEVGSARLRVHGKVSPGSLEVAANRSQATFQLAGHDGQINVVCKGPLPDNLKEDIEVVVEGRLQAGTTLAGDQVLTKCASKYATEGADGTTMISDASDGSGGRR